ncbi:TonB-dependent receptor [Horticoccus luteus]|uniref:TonB-dependent receptor n=1 Tax=Horticoccus luteus TaxID=2862869 RepID=A0A8F9TT22_9BACT|nr:TonB-dependent receptor [Horticoccus luteus]QYM78541.1 TonB-dependent receptor [Horticoccus luteus]
MFSRFLILLSAALLATSSPLLQAASKAGDDITTLPAFSVSEETADDSFDATGMGAVDEEMSDPVFSNELTSIDFDSDPTISGDTEVELGAIDTDSPSERALGQSQLKLRGFPTPSLRNSYLRVGLPRAVNINRVIVIEGPLVPVLGRAAPGGIQNFLTWRPRATAQQSLEFLTTSRDRQRAAARTNGTLIAKRLWQRVAVEWTLRNGPEQFSRQETSSLSAALTWRHNRAASTMVSFDFSHLLARVPPGIPRYRPTAGAKIAGPYLPLALFNSNGPHAAVRRDTGVLNVQSERQLSRIFAMRASAEAWWAHTDQDRFTSPVLVLDRGVFEGVREPRHIEQPSQTLAAQIEFTARFHIAKTEHKLLLTAAQTWGSQSRLERALSTADRAAQPADVRTFDPAAPNYTAPAYDPLVYSRVITDRDERARFSAAELGDRVALGRGIVVLTGGARYDAVTLHVTDAKPGSARPLLEDHATRLSFHSGLNWQIQRNRLLLFATASSGFDPATRVDGRTGLIQPHESTLGYELGLRGRLATGRFEYSASSFLLYNRDIARRNPLYDDPIADANQTQPQLVAAGRERYTGVRLDARWHFNPQWQLAVRGVEMQAATTDSPDLPQEVGRAVPRLPGETASLVLRRRPAQKGSGWTGSLALSYVGAYVANYEDARQLEVDYPGYALLNAGVGRIWRHGPRSLEISLGLRNALARDLLASNARVGAGRELTWSTRLLF